MRATNKVGLLEVRKDTFISFRSIGNGPSLVILNDFFSVEGDWVDRTKKFQPKFTVISFDFRNQGKSSNCSSVIYEDYLDDLLKLMNHLKIKETCFLGISSSTKIRLDFYRKFESRVRSMILCSPVFDIFGMVKWAYLLRSFNQKFKSIESIFDFLYSCISLANLLNNRTYKVFYFNLSFVEFK
jgi:pimeloyl-ACP methyl ester carboxylesterase